MICLTALSSINLLKASTNNELMAWGFIDVGIPLNKIRPGLQLTETLSHRFNNEFQELDITLLRSELSYNWNKNLQSSLGYDHFMIYNRDSNFENRLWQQVLLKKDLNISFSTAISYLSQQGNNAQFAYNGYKIIFENVNLSNINEDNLSLMIN